MRLWLVAYWDSLRGGFWFLPSLMVLGAVALSFVMIHVDRAAPDSSWLSALGWTFTRGPEGSRALLAMVAGSMVTIASVTFSITIVALQLASSQFGPRLLRNFMRDRGNQIAIGTFIATFTYCLLVLRTVNGTYSEEFVPHASVTVGMILALLSLGVLIYFIHHSAESIQAEHVIAAVSAELLAAIDRLYPERLGNESSSSASAIVAGLPKDFENEATTIAALHSDYLQAIDVKRLMQFTQEKDLVLRIDHRPGKFLFKNDSLARAWPPEKIDDHTMNAIRGLFYFGPRRTLVQDIECAIDQLVEVAVRALSPGVNDPFTAINCIDRLGAAICVLSERVMPSDYRYDDQGNLRVVTTSSTVSGIINAIFDQLRQAGQGAPAVLIHLLEVIAAVAAHTESAEYREALSTQANAIHRISQKSEFDQVDREDLDERFTTAASKLASPIISDQRKGHNRQAHHSQSR